MSITDDYYSKYNSEYQDGVLTELGNAANEIRDRAINVYHQSRDSMTSLRDGMRLEADKKAELARVRFNDAKEKVEEMSQASRKHLRRTSQAFKTAFIGTKKQANESGIFSGDYDYIETGYRVNHNSYQDLINSLFTWHNETVNVWSHLIGVILFSLLCVVLMVWLEPRQLAYGE